MTAKKIAELLGIDPASVRGLCNALVKLGVATQTTAEKEKGKKGKTPALFHFTRDGIQSLATLLEVKLCPNDPLVKLYVAAQQAKERVNGDEAA